MLGFIRKRLANKIMIAIALTIVILMIAEIIVRIYFGTKDRIELMNMLAWELASSTYAGIKHPMSVGDAEAIKKQLSYIRETAEDVSVFICDFNREIIYSTHEDNVHTKVEEIINNEDAISALSNSLKTGNISQEPFEVTVSGKSYLTSFFPILNQKECYHCHGASKKVLGSMIIKVGADRVYKTVAAQRNRTLLLTFIGIFFVTSIIYLIVNKFIRRPIESLAEKAKRFAEGDTSVYVDIKTEDEIGVLGNTFNYMVDSVTSFSKKLEEEVHRKTVLLNERTRLLTLLENANKEMRKLDKLKSAFLANMSHELRTPMNSIIGYTDLLLDKVDGPINEEQEKSLRKVASNARHLMQLINDVLDISKIESGKMTLSPKELDFRKILENIMPTFEPLIKYKNLTFITDIAEDLPLIYGDEDKIKQILINLLSNAIKFTNEGSITLSAKISERGVQPGEKPLFAEICVKDTGIGIKEEDQNKIFDKFVQADLTTVRQYEGTGLGLSIARGLVSLHKGMIWVKSKFREGSTFCFTLPLNKEILEKPAEPIIEERAAEALAKYFGTSIDTFLKPPEYAGKPIRCWDTVRCGQPSCPAYGSKERRCWLILGTHCEGMKIAAYPEKVDFCKGCGLINKIIMSREEEKPLINDVLDKDTYKKIIVVIDDNPDVIELIRKYLGEEYHIVGLLNAEDAIDKVKEIKPFAITLDIMMPKKDGWQVLKEIKNTPETQDIPVIILSIVDDTKIGFSLGATDYIVKPVEKQTLLKKLKNIERIKKIKRVLVVDEDLDTVNLIENLLKKSNYEVTTANNSKDAINFMKKSIYDLIVLNPVAQGISLDIIEYLKTEKQIKDISIILVTNEELTVDEIDYLNGKIHGILNKMKLSREDFLSELKNILKRIDNY